MSQSRDYSNMRDVALFAALGGLVLIVFATQDRSIHCA